MTYTADSASFARLVAEAAEVALPAPLWAGIGAFKITAPQAAAQIQASRRAGASGYVLFSYDSMVEGGSGDYLAQVGRAALELESRRSDGGR
jgi:hypothetical protein